MMRHSWIRQDTNSQFSATCDKLESGGHCLSAVFFDCYNEEACVDLLESIHF
jgi:hypothetical protein